MSHNPNAHNAYQSGSLQHPISTLPLSSFGIDTPSSSSTGTGSTIPTPSSVIFDLHPQPEIPSTFLPSYYPDSRNTDALLPSQRLAAASVPGRTHTLSSSIHSSSEIDRLSASGPSARHLLDGVALSTSPPRAPRPAANTPTYDISPSAYTAALPVNTGPWIPKRRSEWNELPSELTGGSNGGGATAEGSSGTGQGTNGLAQNQNDKHGLHNLPQPANPPLNHLSLSQHAFQPNHTPDFIRPQNFQPPSTSRSQSTDSNRLTDPTPGSIEYPGMLFQNIPLPEGSLNPAGWSDDRRRTGEDYAKVLAMYEYINAAIPHIRPIDGTSPTKGGQEYEVLVRMAADSAQIIGGYNTAPVEPTQSGPKPPVPLARKPAAEGRIKPAAKCLGCGATETPEWRRGPMGPRTLCNACGLVHMKLQRKKKKLEEKAAAAAAAAKQ